MVEDVVVRRGDAHEVARDSGPRDLCRGLADLELRVALDEPIALDDRRQVALVRDVEEDRQRAGHEADDVELPDREHAQGVSERDRRQGDGAAEVADDENRAAAETIDPRSGGQGEEDEREELDRPEQREPEGLHVEDQGRHERDRQLAQDVAQEAFVQAHRTQGTANLRGRRP